MHGNITVAIWKSSTKGLWGIPISFCQSYPSILLLLHSWFEPLLLFDRRPTLMLHITFYSVAFSMINQCRSLFKLLCFRVIPNCIKSTWRGKRSLATNNRRRRKNSKFTSSVLSEHAWNSTVHEIKKGKIFHLLQYISSKYSTLYQFMTLPQICLGCLTEEGSCNVKRECTRTVSHVVHACTDGMTWKQKLHHSDYRRPTKLSQTVDIGPFETVQWERDQTDALCKRLPL